ncbi:lactonase family protein [Polaribacter batillariae]|uniref:Lactonase family protein n=1 Tax=Polaribacter batillariae TaxID=2808900 RepID=A0ABX7SW20_9FLAO|nr:lactonase family protein [Polaribacter batillariae]QTD37171.1 lactonase family protein [Polaribacter batillariae]
MKKILLLLTLCISFGCKTSKKETEPKNEPKNMTFYVGTYTKKDSKGIYKYALSSVGKLSKIGLMAETVNPSFLAKSKNNKTLFAVGETDINGTGFISSFKIEKDTLEFISKAETGGANPCFVAVNTNNYMVTANYSGGNVGLLKADNSGKLMPLLFVQQHSGKGTTKRQQSPHAHSAWFHPNKKEIISVDLGTNELWFSKINTTKNKLVFTKQKKLKMADGAGPRHLTFHPNKKWIYVLNELNNTISLVKEKDSTYFIENTVSTLPKNFTDNSKAADIHISDDGKFVYASNRGHNSIAIFEVNPENGNLKTVGYKDVLGDNPRNFSLSPDNKFLVVANQDTNNIISFKRDTATGKLTFINEVFAPTPVCILF